MSTSEPHTNNIVLKLHYYKTTDQYPKGDENIAHREFVSCKDSYSYLNYVDTGATEKTPKDYEEYIGNKEKSCGVFNQDGLLNDDKKKELRHQLQTTQSCIWDMVISFREDFGNSYCRDYEQAYSFLKSELPKFFKRAGLDRENIVWYAGLHENTENKHIHISFFEKEPKYFANGGKQKYNSGKIDLDVLLESKFIFEKHLTNATAQIIKDRKDLLEKYNVGLSKIQIARKGKRLLIELYNLLPNKGRISYDSENMLSLKSKVDEITNYFLIQNTQTRTAYLNFKKDVLDFKFGKHEREYYEGNFYLEDMMRRLGNKTIQTAIKVGRKHNEIEMLKLKTSNYKAIKKRFRQNILDELLDLMENNARSIQNELNFFENYHKKLENYRKQIEYEQSFSKNKYSDSEM